MKIQTLQYYLSIALALGLLGPVRSFAQRADAPSWVPATKQSGATPVEEPRSVPPHVTQASKSDEPGAPSFSTAFEPNQIVFDRTGDGAVWAATRSYKASFDENGATFIPFFGSAAPRNFPIAFAPATATSGGQVLPAVSSARPVVADRRVSFDRGSFVEIYDLTARGMEQKFVFSRLESGGPLVVTVGLATELTGEVGTDGIRFSCDHGVAGYSNAFVDDSAGRRDPVAMRLEGSTIELTVSQAFLDTAVFPLVIDPVISTFDIYGSIEHTFSSDIAFDVSADVYNVVWELVYSATDHDVYSRFFQSNGAILYGSTATIDVSTDYWARPRVANNNIANQFLTVAERGSPTGGARAIWGRTRDSLTFNTLGAQFQINAPAPLGGETINPDVGGDPHPSPPTYYAVIWERVLSAADHDVHGRLVLPNSTFLGGNMLIENTAFTLDTHPAISKSNGNPPTISQEWTVVWQRNGPNYNQIYGAQIHWNGAITHPSFFIAGNGNGILTRPAVSTITDDFGIGRRYMVVFEVSSSTSQDIVGFVVDGPNFVTGFTLKNLEILFGGLSPQYWGVGRIRPSVDSDGSRFAVTYSELYANSIGDYDVYVSTFHHNPSAISYPNEYTPSDVHQNLAFSTSPEIDSRITSIRSAGGGGIKYGVTWTRSTPSAGGDIVAGIYEGRASGGGFSTIQTGCGGLTLGTTGIPALGETITIGFTSPTVLTYGLVVGTALPSPSSLCTGCLVGVDLSTASVSLMTSSLVVPIPANGSLFGAQGAVQGFDFGPGGCPGFRVTDTIKVTVQ